MTNADKYFRKATDKELIKFVDCEMCKCAYRGEQCKIINTGKCKRIKKRWLRKEYNENENEYQNNY